MHFKVITFLILINEVYGFDPRFPPLVVDQLKSGQLFASERR